jgi:hypothetical protein
MRIKMLFPNGLDKALTLSYDDGVTTDIRLVHLMEQYGIKGTFNINTGCFAAEEKEYPKGEFGRMTRQQCLDLFKSKNVEVAGHGVKHKRLSMITNDEMYEEIVRDKQEIERMFKVPCRGWAYAKGRYNDRVVKALENAGIVYARTVERHERFEISHDWLRLASTCHHYAEDLPELTDAFLLDEPNAERSKLFYLWGHSYEFETADKWYVIENFFEKVGNRDDIWYATNIEVYDYVKAFEGLIYSYDMDLVQNPSAVDVWIATMGDDGIKKFCVPSGAVVKLEW